MEYGLFESLSMLAVSALEFVFHVDLKEKLALPGKICANAQTNG
jgi:hypothetical protein